MDTYTHLTRPEDCTSIWVLAARPGPATEPRASFGYVRVERWSPRDSVVGGDIVAFFSFLSLSFFSLRLLILRRKRFGPRGDI